MTKRILIVDDDEAYGRNTARFLDLHGFSCRCESRPGEGLAAAAAFGPALAVIDFEMPGLNGAQLAAGLLGQAGPDGLPMICLTAHPEGAAEALLRVNPLCRVLDKTWGLAGLLAAVREILGKETDK
ncbi:MAG: hypothetical protein A2X29_06610 [Elusimicrobia bacterium GWA2_64_40]|nr:MAG: hypothetical protein A2X29_06610 [Elusimicrobia bacterium GWA2_64_40]